MTKIVVGAAEQLDGVDPARLWAFVADPANLAAWAPVTTAGYLGTELPGAGHTLFLSRGRRERPEAAWRCRIEAWEAGHKVRCALETSGPAQEQEIEVIVETKGTGLQPQSAVRITYRGEVPPAMAVVYRWRIGSIERRALRRIAAAMGAE